MSKTIQAWWYSTINSTKQIGIVKVHDDITNKDKFYIGIAEGINEIEDAEKIRTYGTPFIPDIIK